MSTLPPGWDSWRQEAQRLAAVAPLRRHEKSTRGPHDPKFALGDFLAQVPAVHVEALAESLGEEPGQFRSYREVALAVPSDRRVAAAWSVHRLLRNRPELLRDGLTVREANALVDGKPIDSKPERRLSVDERAQRVRDALADPAVFALIDQELAADRAAQRVRSQARRVVSAHAEREKELQKELRELHAAKSVHEAAVQSELELNKAAQLVHAIGATMTDFPQTDRIVAALKELSIEVAEVLALGEPPASGEDHPFMVVDGEVWQDRPARAALAGSNQEFLSGDGRVVIDHLDDDSS